MKQPRLTTVWILLVTSVVSIYGIRFNDNDHRPSSMIDSNFTSQITRKANEIRRAAELVMEKYSTNERNQSDENVIQTTVLINNQNVAIANITEQFESILFQLDSIVETVESLRNDSIKYREDEKELVTKLFTKQLIQLKVEVGRLIDLYSEESILQKSLLARIDEIKKKVNQKTNQHRSYNRWSRQEEWISSVSPGVAAQYNVFSNRLDEIKVFLGTSDFSGIGTVYSRQILNVAKIEIDEIDQQLDELVKRHPQLKLINNTEEHMEESEEESLNEKRPFNIFG